MGIPITAITQRSNNKKRVRYQDDNDEDIQPRRRLHRSNAMRELRRTHGEGMPLIANSRRYQPFHPLRETQSAANTGQLSDARPEDSNDFSNAINDGDDRIRQEEQRFVTLRSTLAASHAFRNLRVTTPPHLRQFRERARLMFAAPTSSFEASPRTSFEQYIERPVLRSRTSRDTTSALDPFDFTAPSVSAAELPSLPRSRSQQVNVSNSHSAHFDQLFALTRVAEDQGSTSTTTRSSAGNNVNRHAMVIGNISDERDNIRERNFRVLNPRADSSRAEIIESSRRLLGTQEAPLEPGTGGDDYYEDDDRIYDSLLGELFGSHGQ